MSDSVMVSMPYHAGTKPRDLERAIESVGAQTAANVVLVLIADGCQERKLGSVAQHVHAVHRIPECRGRYFADAVTLSVAVESGVKYWMVHDSDDWTEPTHIDVLRTKMGPRTDVVFGGYVRHSIDGEVAPHNFNLTRCRRLKHGTQYASVLWRAEALASIGGPNPGWRVAWDTFLITASATYLRFRTAHNLTYHYVMNEGSLTQRPETGMRSQIRKAAHRDRQLLWYNVRRGSRTPEDVGRIVRASFDRPLVEAVAVEAAELQRKMHLT